MAKPINRKKTTVGLSRRRFFLSFTQRGSISGPLFISFATTSGSQLVLVITSIVLARGLGPTARGELAAVLLWPTVLVGIGSLGIVESTTYYVARPHRAIGTVVGTALLLGLGQSTFLALGGLVIQHYFLSSYGQAVMATGRITVAYIPLLLLTSYLMAALNGLHRFIAFNLIRAIAPVLFGCGIVGIALSGYLTVRSAAMTYLAAQLAGLIVSSIAMARSGKLSYGFELDLMRQMIKFGLQSHVSNVTSFLNERLDQVLIAGLLGPKDLGFYVLAVSMSSIVGLVGSSSALVALPMIAVRRGDELAEHAKRFLRPTLMLSALLGISLLLAAPTIIRGTVGASFLPAVGLVRVLSLSAIALSLKRLLTEIFRGAGAPREASVAELFGFGATLIFLLALLPTIGILGAAFASLIAYSMTAGWMVYRLSRMLNMHPRWLFNRLQ